MTCPTTDLPIDQCACPQHHRPEQTVISIDTLERLAGHPLPAYRMQVRDPRWKIPEPERAVCDHRTDDLCGDCDKILDGLLADLPMLIEQLQVTLRKGHRFAPHGHRRGDVETPDEAPIPWSPPAVRCLSDLHRFMLQAPMESRHWMLTELSVLARRAHRIIDRPPDREVTMCPLCRAEIPIRNRSLAVTCSAKIVEDDPDGQQRVRMCGYAASWEQHRRDLLGVNQDAMLTVNDLVAIFSDAGVNITRDRINNMRRRHGLPRERVKRPYWVAGEVRWREHDVYRLSDVMFLMAQLGERQAG